MSWVSIDPEKCNMCGICALRCARCFTQTNERMEVDANIDTCNLCGHCVSLCPTGAITHEKMDMSNFAEIEDRVTFDTDRFIQFLRQRRSHRSFKRKAVPREDLEKLVDLCRYTPTGSNRQTVELFVIQNRERINQLSHLTVDFFEMMIGVVEKQVHQLKTEGKAIPEDLQLMYDTLPLRKRMVEARNAGLDVIFHGAPAVMIFHSVNQPSTPKDDCVIAAQTVALTARTMGLETCYIGLFEAAARNYPPAAQALKLPAGNTVHSVLILGYPKMKFLRTVDRRPITVRWE